MTRRKTFDASRRNRAREPLEFTLHFDRYSGPRDEDGEPTEAENDEHWTHEEQAFRVKGYMPARTLLRFGDTWDEDRGDISLAGMRDFFSTVMGTREYDRFSSTLDDEDVQLEAPQLAEISQWVFGELGGRPTGRSSDSSPGPSPTGNGSTESAPSPELTQPS